MLLILSAYTGKSQRPGCPYTTDTTEMKADTLFSFLCFMTAWNYQREYVCVRVFPLETRIHTLMRIPLLFDRLSAIRKTYGDTVGSPWESNEFFIRKLLSSLNNFVLTLSKRLFLIVFG